MSPRIFGIAVNMPSEPSARTGELFQKLDRIALRNLSGASPETVHDLRTTARRIETLLSASGMARCGATAKLARQLGKLRRRAGKLRDIDVHIAELNRIRLDNGISDKRLLGEHLSKMRNKGEKKLLLAIDKEVSKGLAKRLTQAARELRAFPTRLHATAFTESALASFKALAEGYPRLTEENLHEFRIRCKRIRYLAEISGRTQPAKDVVSSLKGIQDAIGEWHDWLTLTELARDVLPTAGSSLMAALRTQTRSQFNEALRITGELTRHLLTLQSSHCSPQLIDNRHGAAHGSRGSSKRTRSKTLAIVGN